MTTQIHTRALLVWLTIHTWSARRYDKQITSKVNSDHHASSDAGRFNKMLLPGNAQSYKTLVQLTGAIRAAHYTNTLAWSDEGWRLLPSANFTDYTDWFRKQQQMFSAALDQFVSDYPMLKSSAQFRLGTMYKDEDYPQVSDIRQRFSLDVSYMPVPAQGDIRVDLASDQLTSIEASIAAKVQASADTAMRDAWDRLHTVTANIVERLSDPKAIFRDSLIDNARIICDTLRRLNVTDDPALEAMRSKVERELTIYSPEELRDAPMVRAQVAAKADAILNTMRGFLEVA